MDASEHFVQFYEDGRIPPGRGEWIHRRRSRAGAACIVIATKAHREGLEERLQANGLAIGHRLHAGNIPLTGRRRDTRDVHGGGIARARALCRGRWESDRASGEGFGAMCASLGRWLRNSGRRESDGCHPPGSALERAASYHPFLFALLRLSDTRLCGEKDTGSNSPRFASSTPRSSLMKATPSLPARTSAYVPLPSCNRRPSPWKLRSPNARRQRNACASLRTATAACLKPPRTAFDGRAT